MCRITICSELALKMGQNIHFFDRKSGTDLPGASIVRGILVYRTGPNSYCLCGGARCGSSGRRKSAGPSAEEGQKRESNQLVV